MIEPGEFHHLLIVRETPQGFYLSDEEEGEVLLPGVYRTPAMKIDEYVEVFIYADSEGRAVATTETPLVTLNTAAPLKVAQVNEVGAFCDWGVGKQLFIPFRNQKGPLQAGETAVVYMYLDEQSQRLVGTTIYKNYFKERADDGLAKGQEVQVLIADKSELGYKAIVNQNYLGLLYANEVDRPLRVGSRLTAYVKPLREDGKIDLSLYAVGVENIEPNAQQLLEALQKSKGFLPFTDKSDPGAIRAEFGMSKKMFKKALGGLYRQRKVEIKDDGIHLV
jgi:hypothetical protein